MFGLVFCKIQSAPGDVPGSRKQVFGGLGVDAGGWTGCRQCFYVRRLLGAKFGGRRGSVGVVERLVNPKKLWPSALCVASFWVGASHRQEK